jgi:uncharacterized protein (DUF433 family)
VIIPIHYSERKPNSDKYRIVGKGVTVEFLSRLIADSGWTMDPNCANYNLTPSEVHAAWSFYYDHKEEIDARLATEGQLTPDEALAIQERRDRISARHRAKMGKSYLGE